MKINSHPSFGEPSFIGGGSPIGVVDVGGVHRVLWRALLPVSEPRKPDDLLYFDDVIVDPFKYLSESEFSTGDRTHHEFESRDRVDGQVESINKKKRVCGRKGCALVSVDKRVVVRQRFHESRRFLRHAVVIASLRAEYCGFQQTSVSNTIDPTVLIDLLFVDCENFGDGEVYTL